MDNNNEEWKGLIYEKLAPGDVLLIKKEGNSIIYAVNEWGKLVIKKAEFPSSENKISYRLPSQKEETSKEYDRAK